MKGSKNAQKCLYNVLCNNSDGLEGQEAKVPHH